MPKRPKILNEKAQNTLEYATLLILVMAGIIIAGPFAIRGQNAYWKSLEDGVSDSFYDPLGQAPSNTVFVPGCDCTYDFSGCGVSPCSPFEMARFPTCTPLGCEEFLPGGPPETICEVDLSFQCCVFTPHPTPAECGVGCPPAEVLNDKECGDENAPNPPGTSMQPPVCLIDPGCTTVCCSWNPLDIPSQFVFCNDGGEDDNVNVPMISPPGACQPITAVGSVTDCTLATKCEIICTPTNVPTGSPPSTCEKCPRGSRYIGMCPAGEFDLDLNPYTVP